MKYHVFENMKNGVFALLERMLLFHNIFQSIQSLTSIFLDFFFQFCLKIENDVMI